MSKSAAWQDLQLVWIASNGSLLAALSGEGEENADLTDLFIKPRPDTPESVVHLRIESLVSATVADGPVPVDEVLRRLQATFPDAAPELLEGCLRLHLTGPLFEVTPAYKRTPARVALSPLARAREQRRAYASAFAHELAEQSEQVGRLIGHNPTKGSFRENLVRELLQRHLPKRFHVATGFIDQCPKQIDILIYDQLEYGAIFRAGDLVVVSPESVRAIIEVKSDLDGANTLNDALEHLSAAQPQTFDGPPVFAAIFAFDGASTDFLKSELKQFYAELDTEEFQASDDAIRSLGDHRSSLVRVICVLKKCLMVSGFVLGEDEQGPLRTPAVRNLLSLSGRQPEAAIFFDLLASHLRHPWEGARPEFGLGQIIGADILAGPPTYFYDPGTWGPYHLGDGAPEFMAWCEAYDEWQSGKAWTFRIEGGEVQSD